MQDKWEEEILPGVRRRDVYNYYLDPEIQKKILEDIQGRNVIVKQKFAPHQKPVLRRHVKRDGEFIRINRAWEDPDSPDDYLYWVSRRTVEFHRTTGETTSELIFDIDPGEKVGLQTTKAVVKTLVNLLQRNPFVVDTEIRYSGGRGFYVIAKMNKEFSTAEARELAKGIISSVDIIHPDATVYYSGKAPDPYEIKIDLAPMKPGGSIRAVYSLNAETGRISMPVNNIDSFNPEDADIRKIIPQLQDVIKVR